MDPRAPVIVGAGQVTHRHRDGDPYVEPVTLIERALRGAAEDTGAGDALLRRAQSLRCVAVAGWPYRDAGALVAGGLGIAPRETVQTNAFGGDGPQRLLNETAAQIAAGELDVALIAGGEAVATQRAAQRAGADPGWRRQEESVVPTRISGADRQPINAAETAVGLAAPLDVYAMIESAIGSGEPHLQRIAALWSRFSQVAAANPHAWIRRAFTAAEIATPAPENRAVSSPYTKLLSANIQVDQAAALILCSVDAARSAGVPRDRWVFVHAGAQAEDEWYVTERHELAASPAIRAVGRAALEHAGVGIDDVAHIDLYSCFPAAVQIGAAELGLPLDDPGRPLTVTGGLTFSGGPGNNYSTHGVAALVGRLREDPGAVGLATALGWYLTKHAAGVYSAMPPSGLFRALRPQPARSPARRALAAHDGPATLEAFTVRRDRDGRPDGAVVTALTPAGERAVLAVRDDATQAALLERDLIGARVTIDGGGALEIDG